MEKDSSERRKLVFRNTFVLKLLFEYLIYIIFIWWLLKFVRYVGYLFKRERTNT